MANAAIEVEAPESLGEGMGTDRRVHRNRRHREVRAQVIPISRLTKERLAPEVTDWDRKLRRRERPTTRAHCAHVPRPCPWVGCRHHLWLEVMDTGSLKLTFPDLEPWELPEDHSCSLDVSDAGRVTLEELGRLLNLTRERARQLEVDAVRRFKTRARLSGLDKLLDR